MSSPMLRPNSRADRRPSFTAAPAVQIKVEPPRDDSDNELAYFAGRRQQATHFDRQRRLPVPLLLLGALASLLTLWFLVSGSLFPAPSWTRALPPAAAVQQQDPYGAHVHYMPAPSAPSAPSSLQEEFWYRFAAVRDVYPELPDRDSALIVEISVPEHVRAHCSLVSAPLPPPHTHTPLPAELDIWAVPAALPPAAVPWSARGTLIATLLLPPHESSRSTEFECGGREAFALACADDALACNASDFERRLSVVVRASGP